MVDRGCPDIPAAYNGEIIRSFTACALGSSKPPNRTAVFMNQYGLS